MVQPAPTAAPSEAARVVDHDHIVVLEGVTWADFQRVLEIRGDRPVPRLTYLQGRLELMAPSRAHEGIKSMIGRLVEAWCMERGVEITPYGSWTIESKAAERGAEPDECYVLGDVEEPERPDLAIEVIWTSGGLDKLDVYRKLAVREVWVWKGDRIRMYELRGEVYEPINSSGVLPALDLEQLWRFVGIRPMTRAVREYRAALQSHHPDGP